MEYFKLVIYFVNTKLVRFVISKQQVVYSFKIMEYFLSLIKILLYLYFLPILRKIPKFV